MDFWVWTYNVKANPVMRPAKVRSCFTQVNKRFFRRSLGGVQENYRSYPWYKIIPRRLLGDKIQFANNKYATPNYVGKTWKILKEDWLQSHKGEHAFTPARGVTSVVVHAGGMTVAKVNFHMINKGGHIPVARRRTAERNADWEKNWKDGEFVISQFVLQGIPVFITGDFNRNNVPKFDPHMVWLRNDGIDKIGYVPAFGYRLEKLKTLTLVEGRGGNDSDHPLKGVKVRLTHA